MGVCCGNEQHLDGGAISMSSNYGRGGDIDAAVLAATNFSGGGLAQKLQLSFKCEELPNMDTFSQSDPFCVLYKEITDKNKPQNRQKSWL